MSFNSHTVQDFKNWVFVVTTTIWLVVNSVAISLLVFVIEEIRLDSVIIITLIVGSLIISLFAYYRGYYLLASFITCVIFNIEFGIGLLLASDTTYLFLFLFGLTQAIILTGILIGTKGLFVTTFVQIFLVISVALNKDVTLQVTFMFVVALIFSVLIFGLYQRSLERSLNENKALIIQVQEQAAVLATQNEQLRKLNTEQERFLITLEEKVVERTAELQETIGELNTFSSTVAHDLKNPLGGIIGYGEMLHEELEGSAQAQEQAHLADRIVQIAFRMREIIDSLLLLARTRGAEVQTAPIAMYDVVQSACDRLSYVILHNEVQIHIAAEWPLALGNKAWVEEVWANYLSNAIKYGGKPAIIHVGGEILPETAEARFWVQDNGRGLTPAEQEKLFVPFSQLRQAKDSHGLGLAIVKRITTKLGGTVGVESTVGEGSRFYFTLPLAEELVRN